MNCPSCKVFMYGGAVRCHNCGEHVRTGRPRQGARALAAIDRDTLMADLTRKMTESWRSTAAGSILHGTYQVEQPPGPSVNLDDIRRLCQEMVDRAERDREAFFRSVGYEGPVTDDTRAFVGVPKAELEAAFAPGSVPEYVIPAPLLEYNSVVVFEVPRGSLFVAAPVNPCDMS